MHGSTRTLGKLYLPSLIQSAKSPHVPPARNVASRSARRCDSAQPNRLASANRSASSAARPSSAASASSDGGSSSSAFE
jgi:hypothetical protein